jgi:hypothetical protein
MPEQATPSGTSADLGQREAKNEVLREEQLKHMGGGTEARAVQTSYAGSPRAADALASQARPEQSAVPRTSADLGQNEAKVKAQSKEQSRHMESGPAAKTTQQKKAKRRRG